MKTKIIYSDGYTIGKNPSSEGGGYVVMDDEKNILCHKEIKSKYFTNNEAELLGVSKAIELAGLRDTVITDSRIALCWVMYRKCTARPDLRKIAIKAYEEMRKKFIKLKQEGRESNLAGNYIEKILKM